MLIACWFQSDSFARFQLSGAKSSQLTNFKSILFQNCLNSLVVGSVNVLENVLKASFSLIFKLHDELFKSLFVTDCVGKVLNI